MKTIIEGGSENGILFFYAFRQDKHGDRIAMTHGYSRKSSLTRTIRALGWDDNVEDRTKPSKKGAKP